MRFTVSSSITLDKCCWQLKDADERDAEGEERKKAKVEKDACCGDLLARIQGIERLKDDASEHVYR